MSDDRKPGDDAPEPREQGWADASSEPTPPEFGSPFDYDPTADASMTESTSGTSAVPPSGGNSAGPGWDTYSGVGNGPGWGSGPSYPPPSSDPLPPSPGPVYGTPQPEYGRPTPPPPPPSAPPSYPAGSAYSAPGAYPPAYGGYGDPGAPYGRDPLTGEPLSDKTKVAAGLLQVFLGAFGAGRFYTGHTGIAIGQIAVTWLTCGLGVVWPVIDGIVMLAGNVRDAQGRKLRS
ncbi:TM2 domain-containing protein [Rhodococcus sp. SGAir0479]|uniref:TM2 domain-containing protein n=1 Tax=Rhodococcus sp. SGAir0479 TaxID=2567884 RepID=UPI0010CCC35D|nr:TM2 domain-containing protein [Rhodococcus sp. SGAir0479]QCQ91321.1 NINE protein [Rhodococcus sp. SGAir0479]